VASSAPTGTPGSWDSGRRVPILSSGYAGPSFPAKAHNATVEFIPLER
jgi:hypothetical protein